MTGKKPATTVRPAGRVAYTEALADKICERVATGENLNVISNDAAMPSHTAIYDWLRLHPDFAAKYAQARVARADARSDRIDDYKRRVLDGHIPPDAARVAIDVEKWQAGKENPKRYGDRTALDHGGQEGNPIKADLTVALSPDEAYRRMLDGD